MAQEQHQPWVFPFVPSPNSTIYFHHQKPYIPYYYPAFFSPKNSTLFPQNPSCPELRDAEI
jgi:hypothetical protein